MLMEIGNPLDEATLPAKSNAEIVLGHLFMGGSFTFKGISYRMLTPGKLFKGMKLVVNGEEALRFVPSALTLTEFCDLCESLPTEEVFHYGMLPALRDFGVEGPY